MEVSPKRRGLIDHLHQVSINVSPRNEHVPVLVLAELPVVFLQPLVATEYEMRAA